MQPFYSVAGEWRIQQWLKRDLSAFGAYDEEDTKIVDAYANLIMGSWPKGKE
jgi:hypothetical protein